MAFKCCSSISVFDESGVNFERSENMVNTENLLIVFFLALRPKIKLWSWRDGQFT